MTSFLSPSVGAGFGGANAPSTDTSALQAINSQNQPFANKDFVKNMAWLNNSVDTLSQWSQKLQSGVDQANKNALEQIQGIWSDLFVLFAGLQPTGINIGDVKYVIQGIGALFGINPGTPFPINLFDAAWHLFNTYIIPSTQFTDVIFEAIDAWAVTFGLSPQFMDSVHKLQTALEGLTSSFTDLMNAVQKLVDAFGPDLTPFLSFFDAWANLFSAIDLSALKPVIQLLAQLGIPWINLLTEIVNGLNSVMSTFGIVGGVNNLGPNIVPPVSNTTTDWSIGSNSVNAWIFDPNNSASGVINGSFTTLGNGQSKEVKTEHVYQANPGQVFVVNAKLNWVGIPAAAMGYGIKFNWILNNVETTSPPPTVARIPTGHTSTAGAWTAIAQSTVTVPANVDSMKISAYVDSSITTGQVWVDDISVQLQGTSGSSITSLFSNLLPLSVFNQFIPGLPSGTNASQANIVTYLESLLPTTFFNGLAGMTNPTQADVFQYLNTLLPLSFFNGLGGMANPTSTQVFNYLESFLTSSSPLDLGNAVGLLNSMHIPLVNLSAITQGSPNLLVNPSFDNVNSIQSGVPGLWVWDSGEGASQAGAVKTTGNGVIKELVSNSIPVAQGQQISADILAKWIGLAYTGTPFQVDIVGYLGLQSLIPVVITTLGTPNAPGANSLGSTGANATGWVQVGGTYTVPAGIDNVRLRLYVSDTATAGTIWFDDGSFTEANLMPQGYVQGLLSDLGNAFSLIGLKVNITDYTSLLSTLTGGLSPTLANIAARFTNVSNGGLFDATKLFNQVPFTGVTGIAGAGNIGQSLQSFIDSGMQGLLGGTGTNYLPVDFKTALTTLPNLLNTLAGVGSGGSLTQIASRLVNLGNGGLFDATKLFNQVPFTGVTGLNGGTNIGQTVQDFIDTGVQGILGGTGTGYFLSDWKQALNVIPANNVLGVAGISGMGSTLQQTWDQMYQAFSFLTGGNQSLSSLASAAHGTANIANNAQNIASVNNGIVAGFIGARSAHHGLDPTAVASYNLAQNSNTALAATATVAPMSLQVITQPTTFGNFETVAYKTGTITNFYLNVYKMDATGKLTAVYNSADLASQLSTVSSPAGWVRTGSIPVNNQVSFAAGDIMAIESVVVGSGTVTLRSQSTGIGNHPIALLKNFAATRNPSGSLAPAIIAANAVVFSANQPWHSATVVNVPPGWLPPIPTAYLTPGTYTYNIPAMARVVGAKLDLWCVGAGGGGQANYGTLTWWTGGNAGTWASQTLTCGTDYPTTATTLTVVVGAKGLGAGAFWTNGHAGNASTITWSDLSAVQHTITGNGGAGGGNTGTSGTNGKSPGNSAALNGVMQFGGTEVGGNATGSPPGGGGGGAGPYQYGGDAADGGAWITARQS